MFDGEIMSTGHFNDISGQILAASLHRRGVTISKGTINKIPLLIDEDRGLH